MSRRRSRARPRAARSKPVAGVFMRSDAAPAALAQIPCFAFPEPAAIALARVAAYGEWRRQAAGHRAGACRHRSPRWRGWSIERALERGGGWLTAVEANALLAAVGIAVPRSTLGDVGRRSGRGGGAARACRWRVKAVGRELLHKTEHKAVRLNLQTRAEVRDRRDRADSQSLGDKMEACWCSAWSAAAPK